MCMEKEDEVVEGAVYNMTESLWPPALYPSISSSHYLNMREICSSREIAQNMTIPTVALPAQSTSFTLLGTIHLLHPPGTIQLLHPPWRRRKPSINAIESRKGPGGCQLQRGNRWITRGSDMVGFHYFPYGLVWF